MSGEGVNPRNEEVRRIIFDANDRVTRKEADEIVAALAEAGVLVGEGQVAVDRELVAAAVGVLELHSVLSPTDRLRAALSPESSGG